jgi:hypothetical protein
LVEHVAQAGGLSAQTLSIREREAAAGDHGAENSITPG